MKFHITLDKAQPEITEIDRLTDKLIFRLSKEKKKELFYFAKKNKISLSELVRQIIDSKK
jgi:predicted HicB family RNase H-like nuclease